MLQAHVTSQGEPQSYNHTLGGTLLTAALLACTAHQAQANIAKSHTWQYGLKAEWADQSYQATHVTQVSTEQQLVLALQGLYDDLCARQVDLEPETKSDLYANLWTLYD